jgi:hypothetical protein
MRNRNKWSLAIGKGLMTSIDQATLHADNAIKSRVGLIHPPERVVKQLRSVWWIAGVSL